ncbi:hypothetical protein NUU61_009185 [Penicillium alfredii]|uniref:Uncharacterized protein n=1 Tax=Penicillium alfredii TaxID=1506179 RepID=A0A9W9EMM7_9EURO|nr:uncharacterized protein NUU61_009185 [Penicillium alfredii]KAJ5084606.1 hypothetical protein NUU61_009185 [Penicillium alfredii]
MKATFVVSAMLASLALASPTQPQSGPICKVDKDCKPHEHCNEVGSCVPKRAARDAPLAKLNEHCKTTGDCEKGLLCEKEICVAGKDKRDPPAPKHCKVTEDCPKDLECEKDTCVPSKNKRDAPAPQKCKVTEDCPKDFECEKDTCVPPKQKRADVGDDCHSDKDCANSSKHLTCQIIKDKQFCAPPKDSN